MAKTSALIFRIRVFLNPMNLRILIAEGVAAFSAGVGYSPWSKGGPHVMGYNKAYCEDYRDQPEEKRANRRRIVCLSFPSLAFFCLTGIILQTIWHHEILHALGMGLLNPRS